LNKRLQQRTLGAKELQGKEQRTGALDNEVDEASATEEK
jgi:hypothetical protein